MHFAHVNKPAICIAAPNNTLGTYAGQAVTTATTPHPPAASSSIPNGTPVTSEAANSLASQLAASNGASGLASAVPAGPSEGITGLSTVNIATFAEGSHMM